MRPRPYLVPVVCLALVLAACGGDDGGSAAEEDGGLTAEEQEFADAWAASLQDDETGRGLTDTEVACMGDAIMAELGTAPFEEADISASDINADGAEDDSPGEVLGDGVVSEDQANAILDVWEGCADLSAAFANTVAGQLDLDEETTQCVADGLGAEDLVRAGFISSFTTSDDEPPEDVVNDLLAVVDGCTGSGDGRGASGSMLATSIAEGLAADSNLSPEDSLCLAEGIIDEIGQDRLLDMSADGDFGTATPDVQAEFGQAVLDAAGGCDIPLSELGG